MLKNNTDCWRSLPKWASGPVRHSTGICSRVLCENSRGQKKVLHNGKNYFLKKVIWK